MTGKEAAIFVSGVVISFGVLGGGTVWHLLSNLTMQNTLMYYMNSAEYRQACNTAEEKLKTLEDAMTSNSDAEKIAELAKQYNDFKAKYESRDFVIENLKQNELGKVYAKAENGYIASTMMMIMSGMAEGAFVMLPHVFNSKKVVEEDDEM